ncbi:MAG: M24 family metallopeptidase [Phycisphaerales bacterium]
MTIGLASQPVSTDRGPVVYSLAEIEAIGDAGRVLWSILSEAADEAAPGVTPMELALLVERRMRAAGAVPVMKGLREGEGPVFPAAAAVCVNDHVAHAIPTMTPLRAGDLVRIDAALSLDGWCADAAIARTVPPAAPHRLEQAARQVLEAAIGAIAPGARWSDVSAQAEAEAAGLRVRLVPGFAGHGIGRQPHEPLSYPIPVIGSIGGRSSDAANHPREGGNRPTTDQDFFLTTGQVLTVEPIVVERSAMAVRQDDGWTWATRNGLWACHEERTVAVTGRGAVVLTGS